MSSRTKLALPSVMRLSLASVLIGYYCKSSLTPLVADFGSRFSGMYNSMLRAQADCKFFYRLI